MKPTVRLTANIKVTDIPKDRPGQKKLAREIVEDLQALAASVKNPEFLRGMEERFARSAKLPNPQGTVVLELQPATETKPEKEPDA